MKDLKEYTEEVMRLTEEKRAKKKRARSRALAVGLPCLAAVLCAGAFLISRLGRTEGYDGNKEANASPAAQETMPPDSEPIATNRVQRGTTDLMKGVTARSAYEPQAPSGEAIMKEADFALRLFKACCDGKGNCLISPLSVLNALSMAVNGAEGETLAQMEAVLGMSRGELNRFCADYTALLPSDEDAKLELANSVWFTSDPRFAVNRDFLQTNADYFGAEIYSADFDAQTLRDINAWVNKNTDGMIPEILDEIPEDAVAYLFNALAFDAKWETSLTAGDYSYIFTREDGSRRDTVMLLGSEDSYICSDDAVGFIKYYKGGRYAFVGILPDAGTSISDYIASLDAESLMALLSNKVEKKVAIGIPKFKSEYSAELSGVLSKLGMPLAFDEYNADFSGLGSVQDENISISRVLHKTYISLDEQGTQAAAVTGMEFVATGLAIVDHIILDRPFVYMIIDTETNLPFFIGAMMEPDVMLP